MINNQTNSNLNYLTDVCQIKNKTHLKVLNKYFDLKIIRLVIFAAALISLVTTKDHFLFFASMIYILLEVFFYRYFKLLLNKYELKYEDGVYSKQD